MVYARPNEAVMKFSRQAVYKDNLRWSRFIVRL